MYFIQFLYFLTFPCNFSSFTKHSPPAVNIATASSSLKSFVGSNLPYCYAGKRTVLRNSITAMYEFVESTAFSGICSCHLLICGNLCIANSVKITNGQTRQQQQQQAWNEYSKQKNKNTNGKFNRKSQKSNRKRCICVKAGEYTSICCCLAVLLRFSIFSSAAANNSMRCMVALLRSLLNCRRA